MKEIYLILLSKETLGLMQQYLICTHRLSNVIKNLNIYPKNEKNLDITNGIFFSQRVMLELTNVGFTREQSYKIVQVSAMQAWKENLIL